MMVSEPVAGLVLAGGQGRRFGGLDKGLQMHRGQPLVQHALAHLAGCSPIVISANRHRERYAAFGAVVVADSRADYQGPLSGIESAMLADSAEWWYVVPCDVLDMPGDWLSQLWARAQVTASPWVGSLDGERLQPLLGLWSRRLLPQLSAFLDAGERRVMDFVAPWRAHALPLPEGILLRNLNRPELLAP
jgi:molybdenum cofactor guanylyltransferase